MTNHPDNAPYLGLRPFTESEKDKFFGRDEEIHILTDKILAHRLTLLVAASGVGKSSLLQAGVMPALRASGMADLIYHNDWAVDPARDLKQSIVNHFIKQQRVNADYAPDLDQPLNEFLQTHALLGIGTVVILLDQFEEFFYYQKFSQQRDQFIQQLAAALHDSDTPTAFVFSMREDFAMEMEAFKPFFKGIFDNIYRIEKLELAAARLAILKPIEAFGYHYQPELLEQLLADLGRRERNERLDLQHADQAALTEARVEPPHLQIVCQQLWLHAHASASQEIGLDHYQQLGKAAGILSSYFNDKMAKLDRAQQRLASRAFDLLVSQHGAKMAYPLDELAKLLRENPDSLKISLDQLQTAAILRRIQRQGKPWYELYHDIFAKSITEWNQSYKKKQLREQLLKRGGAGVLTCLTLFASYDGWENHQQRHFRLGKETVSDRIEVYQGASDSLDIFNQRKFIYESDFDRRDIEADKRFETDSIEKREQSVSMQVKQLPLKERFSAYAEVGFFEQSDTIFDAVFTSKDRASLNRIASKLALVRTQQNVERLTSLGNETYFTFSTLASFGERLALPALISFLGSGNSNDTQYSTLNVLDSFNSDLVAPKLVEFLSNSDATLRQHAAISLGNLKHLAATPKLIELLSSLNNELRSSVVEALSQIKNSADTPKLIALLKGKDRYARLGAVRVLAKINEPAVIPEFITLLGHADAEMRRVAMEGLGDIGEASITPKLLPLLRDKDWGVRNATIITLGRLQTLTATPALLALLDDSDVNVKMSAIEALGYIRNPATLQKLIEQLNDPSNEVVISTIKSLGDFGSKTIAPELLALLQHQDEAVRVAAVTALGTLRYIPAASKLIEQLSDRSSKVRASAVNVLGQLKVRAAAPKLVALLRDSDPNMRQSILYALNQIQAPETIPKLFEFLNNNDYFVRRVAATALLNLQASAFTPLLSSLVSGSDPVINSLDGDTIADELGKLKSPVAIPKLIRLLADFEAKTQLAAARSLQQIAPTLPQLTQWQKEIYRLIQTNLKRFPRDASSRAFKAQILGYIHTLESIAVLSELLKDSNEIVVANALLSLADIGALHSSWLHSYIPVMLEFLHHPDEEIKKAAIKALGAALTTTTGQKSSDTPLEQRVLQALLATAQDARLESFMRIAAVNALGKSAREDATKSLLTLLSDPKQKIVHFNIAYWLAKLNYRPAQAELQVHFDELVKSKAMWRAARDAGKFARSDKEELTAQKDNRWQDDYQLYQYAHALARIAPEKDGVALLSHPLYQVRQAAIQALAEKATGALLQQVLAAHQAFNARDLPSPFPTTAYRALDKMLTQLEFNGTKADLALLKTLKAKNFPAQPKQQRALNERFDWTIAELEYRLGKK